MKWSARQPAARTNTKTEPIRFCFDGCLPSPNLFQRSSRLLNILRALCLLISIATVTLQSPHVGYSAEGVPLVLTAQSLMGLPLHWEELLPTDLTAWSGLIRRGFDGFSFPYFVIILYQIFHQLSSTFFNFFLFFDTMRIERKFSRYLLYLQLLTELLPVSSQVPVFRQLRNMEKYSWRSLSCLPSDYHYQSTMR